MVAVKDRNINVVSANELIDEIAVYDLLGRMLFRSVDIGGSTFAVGNITANEQALIVKVRLEDGTITNTKIIY
jgi:uncharacterized protein (UPF0262 family)